MKFGYTFALAVIAATSLVAQTPQPSSTKAKQFTLDTAVELIAADPAAKAILAADLPGFFEHPEYPNVASMSLNQIYPLAQGQITEQQMSKVAADLAKLK